MAKSREDMLSDDVEDLHEVADMLANADQYTLTAEVVLTFGRCMAEGQTVKSASLEAQCEWDIK